MTEELQGLIEHAWRVGNGDPLTAIYMLREWTGLRLSEAARIIQDSPHPDRSGSVCPGCRNYGLVDDGPVVTCTICGDTFVERS